MKEVSKEFFREFGEQIKSVKTKGIKYQIPNILTFSRFLAPFLIVPFVLFNKLSIAVILLILFTITDFLDGRLARKFDCVSEFGIKLDAACDKFFVLGIMIPSIINYPVLIINLLLEFCISYVNIISEAKKNNPSSNIIGKIKTVFLSITLILSYVPNINYYIILGFSLITLILQVIALIKYRKTDIDKDKKKK